MSSTRYNTLTLSQQPANTHTRCSLKLILDLLECLFLRPQRIHFASAWKLFCTCVSWTHSDVSKYTLGLGHIITWLLKNFSVHAPLKKIDMTNSHLLRIWQNLDCLLDWVLMGKTISVFPNLFLVLQSGFQVLHSPIHHLHLKRGKILERCPKKSFELKSWSVSERMMKVCGLQTIYLHRRVKRKSLWLLEPLSWQINWKTRTSLFLGSSSHHSKMATNLMNMTCTILFFLFLLPLELGDKLLLLHQLLHKLCIFRF